MCSAHRCGNLQGSYKSYKYECSDLLVLLSLQGKFKPNTYIRISITNKIVVHYIDLGMGGAPQNFLLCCVGSCSQISALQYLALHNTQLSTYHYRQYSLTIHESLFQVESDLRVYRIYLAFLAWIVVSMLLLKVRWYTLP